jgi:hypothetical protein
MRQNRKNRTVVNRFDLGRVSSTDISVEKPETLYEFAARLQREEQEKINAPVKAAEQQLTATLRQMTEELAQTWRLPLDKLQRFDRNYADALYVELSLPKENLDANPETVRDLVKAEFKTFVDNLPSRGFVFKDSVRFQSFIQTQIIFGGVKIDQAALRTMFDWLVQGQCFPETELSCIPELIPPAEAALKQTAAPLTLEEVLKQGTDGSRDSDRRLREAVENDFIAETRPMAEQFLQHLQTVWGFTPSNEDWRYLFSPVDGWVVRMNKSLTDARTFDACRRHMASTRWPSTMLTAGEWLDAQFRRDGKWGAYQYKLNLLTRAGLVNRPMSEAKDIL